MNAATLFSGIGAPETAMPHWRWPWHAEIEKFPSAVLAARHPSSTNLGDVSADDFADRAAEIGRPDVLVFGSPCQSFSVAGKRLGLDDPRGNLALVALGLVGRLRPRWFVFENVPGLLSSGEGRDLGAFLGTLGELGYRGVGRVLDAQYFGVAQRRRRYFFVGHIGDWRYSAAVLFEPESLRGDSPPRRKAGQGFTHPTAPSLTSSGRGVERGGETRGQDPVVAHCHNIYNGSITGDVAATLGTPGSSQNASGPTVMTSAVRRLTPRECERLQGFPDDYTLIEYRGKPAADGPRYKALGNSMAVPVMRWILSRIEQADSISLSPGLEQPR